jgi:isocitrate dehydrogenase (NAD+)
MIHDVTLIHGDGIGPEVIEATRQVLESTGVVFKWDVAQIGQIAQDNQGTPLPDSVIQSIKKNKVALKGPVTTPIGYGFRSVNVALRRVLDLYACLRPCRIYPGVASRYTNVDIVIVRENTEDLYAGIEFASGTDEAARLSNFIAEATHEKPRERTGFSIKPISEFGSRRIVKYAMEYARANGRKRVTAVHKANIMKHTDGLFLSVARETARDYPSIQFDDILIDNLCLQMVRRPEQFDVLVLPNLYGDIISELAAGMIGGLGLAPSANLNETLAVFEPTHGSAPKYAGLNKTDPMATMLSGVMMLKRLGEGQAASTMEQAIASVITEGKHLTYDLKPGTTSYTAATTTEVAEAVIEKIKGGKYA